MADWQQLGVGGMFALLVLREVFTFVKARKTNGSAIRAAVADALRESTELRELRADTTVIRANMHTVINSVTGIGGVLTVLLNRKDR